MGCCFLICRTDHVKFNNQLRGGSNLAHGFIGALFFTLEAEVWNQNKILKKKDLHFSQHL